METGLLLLSIYWVFSRAAAEPAQELTSVAL